jgi:mannose-6-phosphate isomerase
MFFKPIRFELLEKQLCHYAWGGRSSNGRLAYLAELLSLPDDGRALAELWMGAHPSHPSAVRLNGEKHFLDELIREFPEEILGRPCLAAGFHSLPFLLKILSCDSPLSIQCHPDRLQAARLHAQFPHRYPDRNHKPEILLALTPFEALAGFRELSEVLSELARCGLFRDWLGFWRGAFTDNLRGLCQALFALPQTLLESMLQEAADSLANKQELLGSERLFLRLLEKHPGDRGCLFAFLLKHIQLVPGQALFVAPGQVHAYLQGSGIECMASSDNVIRAGLTNKDIDSEELLRCADFSARPPQIQTGRLLAPGKRSYPVPAPEFRLTMLEQAGLDLAECRESPGILLILQGQGEIRNPDGSHCLAEKGSAWLRPAKLKSGTFTPLAEQTSAVWCEASVVNNDNIS